MKLGFVLFLLVVPLLQATAMAAPTGRSYVIFSDKSDTTTVLSDELSLGVYRAFSSRGFAIGAIGLGDAGKGLTVTVYGECENLAEPIAQAVREHGLAFESCSAVTR